MSLDESIASQTTNSFASAPRNQQSFSPYQELNRFEQQHSDRFFGRDDDIRRLIEYIQNRRITVLHGYSGVGKSSLLCAGVMPALAKLSPVAYEPIYLRIFNQLLGDLRKQFLSRLGATVPQVIAPQEQRTRPRLDAPALRQMLIEHFNTDELHDLCFELRIEYDSLSGQALGDKARELIAYVERRGRTNELVALCEGLRPHAGWRRAYDSGLSEQLLFGEAAQDDDILTLAAQISDKLGKRIVLIFDQFEECFVRVPEDLRNRFIQTLVALSRSESMVHLVFAIRADFLSVMVAAFERFEAEFPSSMYGMRSLYPLSRDQARAAIVQPAALAGVSYEPGLLDQLLNDLEAQVTGAAEDRALTFRQQHAVEPIALQLVCSALFKEKPLHETTITAALYEQLGGANKILGQFLQQRLMELGRDRDLAEQILVQFTTWRGTKMMLRAEEVAQGLPQPATEVERVLDRLVLFRLVRVEERGYELIHEYLIRELTISEADTERKYAEEMIRQRFDHYRRTGIRLDLPTFRSISKQSASVRITAGAAEFMLGAALQHGEYLQEWTDRVEPARAQQIARDLLEKRRSSQTRLLATALNLEGTADFFNDEICANALRVLAFRPPKDYVALLIEELTHAGDSTIGQVVIGLLVELPKQKTLDALLACWMHIGRDSMPVVAKVLARLDERRATNALIARWRETDPRMRARLVQVLEEEVRRRTRIGSQAIPGDAQRLIVLAAVTDSSFSVREAALKLCPSLLNPQALKLLFDLAQPQYKNYIDAIHAEMMDEPRSTFYERMYWLWQCIQVIWRLLRQPPLVSHNRALAIVQSLSREAYDTLFQQIEEELRRPRQWWDTCCGWVGLAPLIALPIWLTLQALPVVGSLIEPTMQLVLLWIPLVCFAGLLLIRLILAGRAAIPGINTRLLQWQELFPNGRDYLQAQIVLLGTYIVGAGGVQLFPLVNRLSLLPDLLEVPIVVVLNLALFLLIPCAFLCYLLLCRIFLSDKLPWVRVFERMDGVWLYSGPGTTIRANTARALLPSPNIWLYFDAERFSPQYRPLVFYTMLQRVWPIFLRQEERKQLAAFVRATVMLPESDSVQDYAAESASSQVEQVRRKVLQWGKQLEQSATAAPAQPLSQTRTFLIRLIFFGVWIYTGLALAIFYVNNYKPALSHANIRPNIGDAPEFIVYHNSQLYLIQVDPAKQAPSISEIPESLSLDSYSCVQNICIVGEGSSDRHSLSFIDQNRIRKLRLPNDQQFVKGYWLVVQSNGSPLLWALSDEQLFSSSDLGGTWLPASAFAQERISLLKPLNEHSALVVVDTPASATFSGLSQTTQYMSDNGGASWSLFPSTLGDLTWSRPISSELAFDFRQRVGLDTRVSMKSTPDGSLLLAQTESLTATTIWRGERGTDWTPVLSFDIHPGKPACGATIEPLVTKLAGTREIHYLNYSYRNGETGLLVSLDRGQTWTRVMMQPGRQVAWYIRYLHRCEDSPTVLTLFPQWVWEHNIFTSPEP